MTARGWLWLLGLGLLGCVAQVDEGDATGALALGLRQTSADGAVYRLSEAQLVIAGAADLTLSANPDDEALDVELPAGDYTLSLEPGFVLERQDGGAWVAVAASLASDNPQPFTIAPAQQTAVALRFVIDGGTDVALTSGSLAVQLAVEPAGSAGGACAPRLVINELDYDQEGADTADFAELYNAASCALDTAGLSLVLLNGGAAGAPSYAQIDLSAVGATLAPHQYVVVSSPEVVAVLPSGTSSIAVNGFSIQNGSPDGARVEQAGVVLDSVTYGGVIDGLTETQSAPADRGAGSLGRCPDGHDTNDNGVDFAFHATPTPGAANACP